MQDDTTTIRLVDAAHPGRIDETISLSPGRDEIDTALRLIYEAMRHDDLTGVDIFSTDGDSPPHYVVSGASKSWPILTQRIWDWLDLPCTGEVEENGHAYDHACEALGVEGIEDFEPVLRAINAIPARNGHTIADYDSGTICIRCGWWRSRWPHDSLRIGWNADRICDLIDAAIVDGSLTPDLIDDER